MSRGSTAPPLKPLLTKAVSAVQGALPVYERECTRLRSASASDVDREAIHLLLLSIRHFQGLLSLAAVGDTRIPSAHAASRAILEVACKALWVVDHNLTQERNLRWLAHLEEELRVYERSALHAPSSSPMAEHFRSVAETYKKQVQSIKEQVAKGSKAPSIPTAQSLMQLAGMERFYPLYIYMSQFVHGGHSATWQFKGGAGLVSFGEEIVTERDWSIPVCAAWSVFSQCADKTLRRCGKRESTCLSPQSLERIDLTIARLGEEGSTLP